MSKGEKKRDEWAIRAIRVREIDRYIYREGCRPEGSEQVVAEAN